MIFMDASLIRVVQTIIKLILIQSDGRDRLKSPYFNKTFMMEENDLEVLDTHELNGICPYQLLTYICSLISIPCIITTILVYIFIPELRNLHGTCLICYLMFMALSIVFTNPYIALNMAFKIAGCYLGLCAIHWLQVISFDMWWNFKMLQSINRSGVCSKTKRFFLYSLYACLAPMFTFLPFAVLIFTCTKLNLKEGEVVINLIYLSLTLPVMIFFFTLTTLKIRRVQLEIKRKSQKDGFRHKKNLKTQQDYFAVYLRLFILMGAHVCCSTVLYIVSYGSIFSHFVDICLSLEGVWLFILLVIKRKVLFLIKQRFCGKN